MGIGFRITETALGDMTVSEQVSFLSNMLARSNLDLGNLSQILNQALHNGIDLNTPLYDVSDRPCFVHIARTPGAVDALVDAGADIMAQDSNGKTALHYAVENHDDGMISHLSKKYPALLSIADNKGNYPVQESEALAVLTHYGGGQDSVLEEGPSPVLAGDPLQALLEQITKVEWCRTGPPSDDIEMVLPDEELSRQLSECARHAGVQAYAVINGRFRLIEADEETMSGFMALVRSSLGGSMPSESLANGADPSIPDLSSQPEMRAIQPKL